MNNELIECPALWKGENGMMKRVEGEGEKGERGDKREQHINFSLLFFSLSFFFFSYYFHRKLLIGCSWKH